MNSTNSDTSVSATAAGRPKRAGIDLLTVAIFMLPMAVGVFTFVPYMKALQAARETGEFVSPYYVPPMVTTAFYVSCCLLGLAAVAALCWWTFKTSEATPTVEQ